MPASFASLPAHDRQAFFALLDEYFESRPHLMPNGAAAGGAGGATGYERESAAPPPPVPAPRSQPPAPAARKPAPASPPSTSSSAASRVSSGLSTGKSMGRLDMSSKGAAFGSMIMGRPRPEAPATPGEAMKGVVPTTSHPNSQASPPPAPAPRSTPAPPPPARAAAESEFGQAEVLYDYAGGEAEDLTVKRFEVIDLTEKVNDDWWKASATDGSGRTGIVPSAYVKRL